MRRPCFLCLVCVTAGFLTAIGSGLLPTDLTRSARAENGPAADAADTIVLATGERVACTIVKLGAHVVTVQIGAMEYTFERAQLNEIQQAGQSKLDPEWLAFVRDNAPRLSHPDARLARAARAGLEALGEAGRPYFEAVAVDIEAAGAREALLRLDLTAGDGQRGDGSRFIDRQVEWARSRLDLTKEQEPGFRTALGAFFQDLRSSGDRQAAIDRYREALARLLDAAQMKKYDEAMKELRSR